MHNYEPCFGPDFKELSFLCLIIGGVTGSSVDNAEGALVKQLLTNYDPDIKPTTDPSDPVNISISFFITRIENLVRFQT